VIQAALSVEAATNIYKDWLAKSVIAKIIFQFLQVISRILLRLIYSANSAIAPALVDEPRIIGRLRPRKQEISRQNVPKSAKKRHAQLANYRFQNRLAAAGPHYRQSGL